VPASVQLDGKQVELFVEGESLGRWSLVDVRAERLISSAFSLKLAGEEVTFIADQPTEFAYGGVEAMANVWAKHRSMRLPLRMVANSRSRQGTKPSRIPDLRDAIEETLAGTSPTALRPARLPARNEASGVASLREARGHTAPDIEPSVPDETVLPAEDPAARPEPQQVSPEPEPLSRPAAAKTLADPAHSDSEETPDRRDPVPDSPDTPDAFLAEKKTEQVSPPPGTDSVFKQSVPWATSEEAETEDPPAEASVPPRAEPEVPAPVVAESPVPDQAEAATEVEQAPEPAEAPEPAVSQPGSVPWLAPPADDPPAEAAGRSPEPSPEPPPEDAQEVEPIREPEFVVDLGVFENRGEDDRREDDRGHDEVEAVPAVADDDDASQPMVATAARGGIMGAVRSAFVRNRVEHTHVYVEAPGGLGIKRQICAECGHISIGME